jgi:hypothetical protein
MVHVPYPQGNFLAEYASIVNALTEGRAYDARPAGFFHGVTPEYDRRWEYERALAAIPVDLGRSAIELAAPESFFGLFASAYYGGFTVADVLPGDRFDPEARRNWAEVMATFPERLAYAPALPGPVDRLFDAAFAFRIFENIPDDFALMARLREVLAHDAHVAISVAFSHAGEFAFDAGAGFRVYGEERLRALLDGFQITSWQPLESASEVATSPRPFDLTLLHVGAKRV